MSGVNERELVRWLSDYFDHSGDPDTGIGDDAALLERGDDDLYALTIDTILEGRHFRRDEAGYDEIGHKAASVSLSDLAAMGAQPESMLVSSGLEESLSDASVRQLFEGIRTACDPFDCAVSGGDLYRTDDGISLTTVGIGPCPYGPVRRNGLADRDVLFVTGRLGGSLLGRHLSFTPRVNESLWLARYRYSRAMIDVSDGLVIDLDRLLEQSDVSGAVLHENRIPIHPDARTAAEADDRTPLEHALYDGEDFELLFSTGASRARELTNRSGMNTSLTRIGHVDNDLDGIFLKSRDGSTSELSPEGYLHF